LKICLRLPRAYGSERNAERLKKKLRWWEVEKEQRGSD
jgi:hypothetical protein